MRYIILLFLIISCASCSVVSSQAYYVPTSPHQTIKDKAGYFKMIRSQVGISDSTGNNIGSITISNGIGTPILAGPLYLPVLPVGIASLVYSLHKGADNGFVMDINIKCRDGYVTSLAIDSSSYKRINDSLNVKGIRTAVRLNTNYCYMVVNNSKKIPLHAEEFFMGNGGGHSYRLYSDVKFSSVNTLRLVTGNATLDNTLRDVTFKRKHRLTYCIIGPS